MKKSITLSVIIPSYKKSYLSCSNLFINPTKKYSPLAFYKHNFLRKKKNFLGSFNLYSGCEEANKNINAAERIDLYS